MGHGSALTRAAASRISAVAAVFVCLVCGSPAALAGDCEAARLGSLLGKPYSKARADELSKAGEIRTMTLGKTAVTAKFISSRLNIVVDVKGIVVRADCG